VSSRAILAFVRHIIYRPCNPDHCNWRVHGAALFYGALSRLRVYAWSEVWEKERDTPSAAASSGLPRDQSFRTLCSSLMWAHTSLWSADRVA